MAEDRRTSGRARRVAAALGLLQALSALASGHSFWPTYYSARSAIGISDAGLQAVVVVEVPTAELVADFRRHYAEIDLVAEIEAGRFAALEDEYRDWQFERFADDLGLEIDGRTASGRWRPVETPVNGRGTEGFFVYMLEFVFEQPPAPEAELRVRLVNAILPDAEMVLANQVQADDGWRVTESSIPEPEAPEGLPEGAAMVEELALWSEDPVKRDLRVTLVRAR